MIGLKNIRHTGIIVSNLENSLYFYEQLLGFKVAKRMDESGSFIDNFSNLKNILVTTVKMLSPDGQMIELLHYKSHPRTPTLNKEFCEIGVSHFAITVENIQLAYDFLISKGVHFNAPPQNTPDGYAKVTFMKDPDGSLIEMVEVL